MLSPQPSVGCRYRTAFLLVKPHVVIKVDRGRTSSRPFSAHVADRCATDERWLISTHKLGSHGSATWIAAPFCWNGVQSSSESGQVGKPARGRTFNVADRWLRSGGGQGGHRPIKKALPSPRPLSSSSSPLHKSTGDDDCRLCMWRALPLSVTGAHGIRQTA